MLKYIKKRSALMAAAAISFWSMPCLAQGIYVSGYPTDPPQAEHLIPVELGQLLLAITDIPNDGIPWNFLADEDESIHWITDGVDTPNDSKISQRVGIVRVHVLGHFKTVLHRQTTEVTWNIKLESSIDPKFDAERIEIGPSDACGMGCSYYPLASIEHAGMKATKVCHDGKDFGGNLDDFFEIIFKDKPKYILEWIRNAGSAGESEQMFVYPLSKKNGAMRKDDERYAFRA